MLHFYHKYAIIYRKGVKVNTQFCGTSLEEERSWQDLEYCDYLTWENLSDKYYNHGFNYNFTIYTFKKGRVVSFFNFSLFNKITWDIFEWKNEPLDLVVAYEYKKFTPSLEEIYKWHDADKAIQYLEERKRITNTGN